MTAAVLVPGLLALLWNGAGTLAYTLPAAASARALRRRTVLLVTMTATAAAVAVGAALAPTVALGGPLLLAYLAALAAAAVALPRLRRLASAARAFAPAPDTPTAPALRAMAAHPLVGAPMHAAGAAALLAVAAGLGAWRPAAVTVVILLASLLGVTALGHAHRHSRLSEPALLVGARPAGRHALAARGQWLRP